MPVADETSPIVSDYLSLIVLLRTRFACFSSPLNLIVIRPHLQLWPKTEALILFLDDKYTEDRYNRDVQFD